MTEPNTVPSYFSHYHYHYHYYYPFPTAETQNEESVMEDDVDVDNDSDVGSSTEDIDVETDAENESESDIGYIRQGIDILDKDRGILSSYGYCNVTNQTVQHRRQMLKDATQYLSKDYIQERLYYIASVQPENKHNPFMEDLLWFEKTYHLTPYMAESDSDSYSE